MHDKINDSSMMSLSGRLVMLIVVHFFEMMEGVVDTKNSTLCLFLGLVDNNFNSRMVCQSTTQTHPTRNGNNLLHETVKLSKTMYGIVG